MVFRTNPDVTPIGQSEVHTGQYHWVCWRWRPASRSRHLSKTGHPPYGIHVTVSIYGTPLVNCAGGPPAMLAIQRAPELR
jgi:hypothetical protein